MIKTLTSIIFGNIKLISYKYSLLSNKISSQIRLPTMQQHGRNRQQAGDNRQHHGGNQQQHGGNRGNQKEEFVFFFGPKCTFSQMHRAKFTIDGEEFCCMEQYMQYQKAVTCGDVKTAKLIMSTQDPKEHKKLGRKVSPFKPQEWGWKSRGVVRKGNIKKYEQNPSMKNELFRTHPKTLVEASPRDRLWGIGLGKDNPKARDRSQWRGKNLLGQVLTEVRDHLMAREGLISSQSSSIEERHKAKLDDKNSSLKINTNAENKKTDHEKHNLNKKDKHVSEKYDVPKYRNPNRYDISKSDRHDKEIPCRSKGRGETTPKKERSGDRKSSSSKKGRHEGDSGSDGSHLGDAKSRPSKKRKREGNSHSEQSHQSDEDRPSPKKSRHEGDSRSDRSHLGDGKSTPSKKRKHKGDSHSEQSYQSDEDGPSLKKSRCEGDSHTGESHGKGSLENNENVTNNRDEKAAYILEPPEVKEGEQDKEKDRDVETEKTCNKKADKSEARATTEFIITNAPKNEDDTHPDGGKNKQKKITVRLQETVCDKDERSNKDAAKTCKSDALELIAGYGTEDANELEKVQNPNLPAEEKKCDDPDTSQKSKDIKP